MKSHKTEAMRILFVTISLALFSPSSSPAQTNRAALLRSAAIHSIVTRPVVTGVITNAGPSRATMEVKLPKDLSRYHVLEQHAQGTRAATNLVATSTNKVRASLLAGTTLMFMEKEPQE